MLKRKGNFYTFSNRYISTRFFIDIKKTLDKYSFSDKSEEIYGGQITSKEITSDKIIDNLEFGVGVANKIQSTMILNMKIKILIYGVILLYMPLENIKFPVMKRAPSI